MSAPAPTTPKARKPLPVGKGGRKKGATALNTSQKAEAVALWRAGDTTLEQLAKRFGKRPETFSRLFKRMGIKKGENSAAVAAAAAATVEARSISDIEQNLRRIAKAKEDHFKMSDGLAKIAWAEIVRARTAGLPLSGLKDTMLTIKIASEVIGNTRKEMWVTLGVEEAEKKQEFEDLPELTVRELAPDEVGALQQAQAEDEMGISIDPEEVGASMVPDDPVERP
jgi:hypothetical protein